MKYFVAGLVALMSLSGCATMNSAAVMAGKDPWQDSKIQGPVTLHREQNKLPAPRNGPITVAVYNFQDRTGQRMDQPNVASFSSAVTQGADAYLIKTLSEVGGGKWFRVIERVGMENLVKERQVIRQMREIYQGRDAKPVDPLLFAGMIIEGGIIGYDSNTQTGGAGARWLGISGSTQWRQDTVVVNLRAVNVNNGEIIVNVTVTKSILSYQDGVGMLKFLDAGTKALEAELGTAINESRNIAIVSAIETGVVEMIRQGEHKGYWQFTEGEAK
jgi:curli production assembly/transport component CsgG